MIDSCSPDGQHGRNESHPANDGCSFFMHTNDDIRNLKNQSCKRKTWTREYNQLALHCYFRSNTTQRGYRKRMIEIWQECVSSQTTTQRLSDQVRTIIKKVWFSDLEILDIHQKINNEQDNTVPDTKELSNKNSLTEMNIGKWKRHTTKQPESNTITRTKSKCRKFKENYEQWKTILPSLRNIE